MYSYQQQGDDCDIVPGSVFDCSLYVLDSGGRFGGIGLGAAGGLGLAILTFGFGLPPDSPPITVISIIIAVITCVTILQAAGGLDLLVTMAEKILRKWPGAITFLGPFVAFLFTALCGTGYVAFSVYPVIAEIATDAGSDLSVQCPCQLLRRNFWSYCQSC